MAESGKRKFEEEEAVKEADSGGKKSKEEEETVKEADSEDEEEGEEYDSDDQVMFADGRKMKIKDRKEYYRQLRESESFDITIDLELGRPIGAPIIPQRGKENTSKFVELSRLAIADYNSKNATQYEFVENVTVNISFAAGMWCYITFLARDAPTPDALTTFQALAWWGIDGDREVEFCRLKKPSH